MMVVVILIGTSQKGGHNTVAGSYSDLVIYHVLFLLRFYPTF